MGKRKSVKAPDLYGMVKQSASDKVIGSVSYPFTAVETQQAFPGCTGIAAEMAAEEDAPFYELSKREMKIMLSDAVVDINQSQNCSEASVSSGIYSFAGDIIQQAKHVIDAATAAGGNYEGPDVKELKKIVDKGIKGLVDTLGDWGMYEWCPYLRVVVEKEPNIKLSSPRIDLNGIKIKVTATGELWAKHPWWNCHQWCTKWEKVIKCTRIASITVSPRIKAEAHAILQAAGTKIFAQGKFDKLCLNYKILDKIPLEGLANKALRDKLVFVYDASAFVATVPLLGSNFAVGSLTLPPSSDGLNVGISVQQVK